MSVVVAYQKDGVIYLGCDTQTTAGGDLFLHTGKGERKIVQTKSGIFVGRVGSVRTFQKVLAKPEIFSLDENGELTMRHIVTKIIPQMLECYREYDLFENKKEDPPSVDATYLLAYRDKMYCISRRFYVCEVKKFVTLGAGGPFAFPVLNHVDESQPIQPQLKKALRIASDCSTSCSAPFWTVDTATQKFKLEK